MSKHVLFSVLILLMFGANNSIEASSISSKEETPILFQEDTYLLLAHKWESGKIFLDLSINGTFEGDINNQNDLYGNWEIIDQKTLILTNSPEDEEEFKFEYKLSNVSFDSITLVDKKGKTIVLEIAD